MPPVSEGAKLQLAGEFVSAREPVLVSRSVPPIPEVNAAQVHWYATYTCARHEKSVARQLQERNINCFLPLYKSWHRWADRRKQVELALFPGYVFVHIDPRERLRVLQLPGVVRLVGFNGAPAPLPENDIESLRNGLEQGIYAQPHPYLRTGRRVLVVRGPLAGAQGVLLRKKDKLRFVISIDVLMRSVAVELDAEDIVSDQ
jgi:transcription antitermination factor NusG